MLLLDFYLKSQFLVEMFIYARMYVRARAYKCYIDAPLVKSM